MEKRCFRHLPPCCEWRAAWKMKGPLGWSSYEKGCWGHADDSAGVRGVGRPENSLWGGRAWPGWGGGRGEMGVQDSSVCSYLGACCEVYRG